MTSRRTSAPSTPRTWRRPSSCWAIRSKSAKVMEIETALAKASLTRVDKRDPYKLFHKMKRAELVKLTPSFAWGAYWKAVGLAAPDRVNVTEPEFFKEVERQLKSRSLADWKVYL